jgi:hypothetical protein
MPIILATLEAEIRRIRVQGQPRQIVLKLHLENTQHNKGRVEWLKHEALSSNPSNLKNLYFFYCYCFVKTIYSLRTFIFVSYCKYFPMWDF